MRLMNWKWTVIVSALLLSHAGLMQVLARPKYGGTLRVATRSGVPDLHPGTWVGEALELSWKRKLSVLVFEGLLKLDQQGKPHPLLAQSWKVSDGGRRWEFRLRAGVRLHDGTPLTPAMAADVLRASVFDFPARAEGDGRLVIESDTPDPHLPARLAHPGSAIYMETSDGVLVGTGPFSLNRWERHQRAHFVVNEEYWQGRPYLDRVEISMGRSLREQRLELQAGAADLVELPLEALGTPDSGLRFWSSPPLELVLLAFSQDRSRVKEADFRRLVEASFNREAVHEVLLGKRGEPAKAFLPQWLTGYAFLFGNTRPASAPPRATITGPPLLIGYAPSDSLARTLAERLALDCSQAGIAARAVPGDSPGSDLTIKRIRLNSLNAALALRFIAEQAGLDPDLSASPGLEDLLAAESTLLDEAWAVPLFYLPVSYGLSERIKFRSIRDFLFFDDWSLADIWLEPPLASISGE
jgi:peptide/nickel transport system substrate-binding protein